MNLQKPFFILSLVGILFLLFLSQSYQKPIISGKISEIKYGNNKISIFLENNQTEIIVFTNKILNLKKEQEIEVYGNQETYQNKVQIIADKIIK